MVLRCLDFYTVSAVILLSGMRVAALLGSVADRCCCMVQVSNDVRMLLPILVGILAAKWVADAATHSLYHGLLEVPLPCAPALGPGCAINLDKLLAVTTYFL